MSNIPSQERTEPGLKRGLEFPKIHAPKKITEEYMGIVVKDVIQNAEKKRNQIANITETSLDPDPNSVIQAWDEVVTGHLRRTLRKKAEHALKILAQKIAPTASALAMMISNGCGNVDMPTYSPTATPAPISLSGTPRPPTEVSGLALSVQSPTHEAPRAQDYKCLTFKNVKVFIDKEGLPVEYVLPDGKKIQFDKVEIERIREKAIYDKEPEVISVISLDRLSNFSTEHPKVTELPEDVLSEEELEKRGVEIIQDNENDYGRLYIREAAFEKGALLEDFNNTGRKLTINISYYGEILDTPKIKGMSLDELRAEGIKNEEEHIEVARILTGRAINSPYRLRPHANVKYYEDFLIDAKARLYAYNKFDYRDDILNLRSDRQYAGGLYSRGYDPKIDIFLRNPYFKDLLAFYFSADGEFKIHSNSPDIRESYPNPASFEKERFKMGDREYVYGPSSSRALGFLLGHELSHDKLIQQRINKGKTPIDSESDTDLIAMAELIGAWEKWEKSGFTDNTGDYFIFSLPREQRYILTENKSPAGSSAPKKL